MKNKIIYIITLFLLFFAYACNYNDDFNLVPQDQMTTLSYNGRLTAPLVNIDTAAYTIVEIQGHFWFTAFDKSGNMKLINDVSNIFSADFSYNNLKKLEYYRLNDLFVVYMKIDNEQTPFKLLFINPKTGQITKSFFAPIPIDTNFISNELVGVYFTPDIVKVFVFTEFTDTLQVYHKAIIKYDCFGNLVQPQDTLLLDSQEMLTVWNKFIINGNILDFFLIQNFDINDLILNFKYNFNTDSLVMDTIVGHFLPISYVNISPDIVFSTIYAANEQLFPVFYSLQHNRYYIADTIYSNYIITNKLERDDSLYIIGYNSSIFLEDLNFANYNSINGYFTIFTADRNVLLSDMSLKNFDYQSIKDLKRFAPYGILDNGQGFTIIAKADAFEYFPAILIIKTDYHGKPVNSYYNAERH